MIDFLLRKTAINSTRRMIEKLDPPVEIHMHDELTLTSVQLLKKMAPIVSKIKSFEDTISNLSDSELQAKTQEYKKNYTEGMKDVLKEYDEMFEQYRQAKAADVKEDLSLKLDAKQEAIKKQKKKILDGILPEAFAVVRETGKRVLIMRHFDVQMIGGMVLHGGDIAEMTTGEGKTLVATLPAYLNALTGEGVHVVTVNDYLAKRDSEWMGPLYQFLGLTVGVIQHDMAPEHRQQAYGCDITYGTNNEFGFDYLRDNMVNYKEDMAQRVHHFCIVDEVDSILIDEARTPLIISGPSEQSTDKYFDAHKVSQTLKGRRVTEKDEIDAKHREEDLTIGFDYMADEKAKSISLTEQGEETAAKAFGVDNLHEMETVEYRHHILQSLKAKEFFNRDVDYVVKDGQVIIVDEFTGRLMPGRRWSDGLHQAVEAAEGIKIERENQTLATITFQNYFRLYEKLSGMTGTADTEASEFKQIYDLEVVVVPTNRPIQRQNHADSIYRSLNEKYNAVVDEIEEFNKRGQPVLVGTISIEKSEMLARMLKAKGVPHQVLNAKFHEMEANIIAQAGRYKGVTIATNMAGRGTDINLGGNAEQLALQLVSEKAKDVEDEDEKNALTKKFLEEFRTTVKEEHKKVIELGGLHVLGTERHESRRIDNQLRGRQGRQGDPGSSRFFVSMEDDLMRIFGSDRIMGIMDKLGLEEGQAIEHPWLSKALENAQKRVEGHNFEIRKHLIEYDNVMNRQREVIYSQRRNVLDSEDIKDLIMEAIEDVADQMVGQYMVTDKEEISWDVQALDLYLSATFNFSLGAKKDGINKKTQDEVRELIENGMKAAYDVKEQEVGSDQMRYIERMLFLHTIDTKWKDHLYAMDQLKEGVGLRSFAQRDPVIEYKKEGFEMFQMMYESINRDAVETLFKMQARRSDDDPSGQPKERKRPKGVFSSLPQKYIHDDASGLSGAEQAGMLGPGPASQQSSNPKQPPVVKSGPKVGRNDPCPCGSGKKHKKCCGA